MSPSWVGHWVLWLKSCFFFWRYFLLMLVLFFSFRRCHSTCCFYSRQVHGNSNRHIWICNSLPELAKVFAPAGRLWWRLLWCSFSGNSLSSEHQVSFPYDWNEMFWTIHELQMPLCGYIKTPLRPHGISHLHVWENNKDRANRFLYGYVFLLSTICPCLNLWLEC